MGSYPNFKLRMMKLCCQGSQIKILQESFFSFKTPYELIQETSRSPFSFLARECARTLCDMSDFFHTLHRLQRMIKKDFYNKILHSKDLEFTYHSKIKTIFLQKNKNPMSLMRLTTHLGKVNNNPSNYYISNKKKSQ